MTEHGQRLPPIGLGTWEAFDVDASGPERSTRLAVLRRFFELGGRVIDTSPMYGRAEAAVGSLLPEIKGSQHAFIATKVWTRGAEAGLEQMTASERLLGRAVDLMQVHNLVDVETHLETLAEWKHRGRIGAIGITHYGVEAFDELERWMKDSRVEAVQLPYSVATREAETRLLPLALERGLHVIVNRPFEGGDLFARTRGLAMPRWSAEVGCTSWAQLMLKFIVSHPAVTCVIPATSKPHHLEDNMAAGRGARLDEAQRTEVVTRLLG